MIVCPVCEHAQPQGGECEVCGKRLGDAGAAPRTAVAPLEGLEGTSHAPAAAAPAPLLLELEPTRAAPAGPVLSSPPGATGLELEPTRTAPVDVATSAVPDLERTLEAPVGGRTAPPAVTVCRYCRTPAAPDERVCSRCGMRLPRFGAAAPAAAPEAHALCSCGTPIQGALCPSCGARNTRD